MSREIKLDKNTMIVSETDTKGVILYANSDFCKIAGYTKEQLIGQPHNLVRDPDMPRSVFKILWETIQSGKVWNGIVKNKTISGEYYWVNATIYPSTDANGNKRYISVRIQPTKEEVEEAINLYKRLT